MCVQLNHAVEADTCETWKVPELRTRVTIEVCYVLCCPFKCLYGSINVNVKLFVNA